MVHGQVKSEPSLDSSAKIAPDSLQVVPEAVAVDLGWSSETIA